VRERRGAVNQAGRWNKGPPSRRRLIPLRLGLSLISLEASVIYSGFSPSLIFFVMRDSASDIEPC
jgi:hypothetical protein